MHAFPSSYFSKKKETSIHINPPSAMFSPEQRGGGRIKVTHLLRVAWHVIYLSEKRAQEPNKNIKWLQNTVGKNSFSHKIFRHDCLEFLNK